MIEDEDLFQKPKQKRQKLYDHQNGKSNRSTQNKSTAHKKDLPDKFKEAYEKFGLDNAELNDR